MKYSESEKEIIRTIVKFGKKENCLADIFNVSKLFEKKGIVLCSHDNQVYVFTDKRLYDLQDHQPMLYLTEFMSLVDTLFCDKLLISSQEQVAQFWIIGKEVKGCYKINVMSLQNNEFLNLKNQNVNILSRNGEQLYWPKAYSLQQIPLDRRFFYGISISEELKDLVKHNFKSEGEIRFKKQCVMTWTSIGISTLIGLMGLFM